MAHPKGGYKIDGKRVPGTTTIIGRFKESGALLWWAFGQGKAAERGEIESLYDKRDEAGETGTAVHWLVYRHESGETPLDLGKIDVLDMGDDGRLDLNDDRRQQLQSGFDAYMTWRNQSRLEITHQEIQLVSHEYRFGGCPDAIGLMGGEPVLIDWKTSKGIYPDMLIQLAAYGHLVEHGECMGAGGKLGISVQGFHLCKFSKDSGDFSHHYFGDLSNEWEQFKLFRQAYDRDKAIKKRAA